MNDPTLWAMGRLLHRTPRWEWDAFANLSGDALPVVSAHRISRLFAECSPLGNTNFVTSSSCLSGLVPTSVSALPEGLMKRAH